LSLNRHWLNFFISVCVIGLACIPLLVPPALLSLTSWRILIVAVAVLALVLMFVQALVSGRAGRKREKEGQERDRRFDEFVELVKNRISISNGQVDAAAGTRGLQAKTLSLGHDLFGLLRDAGPKPETRSGVGMSEDEILEDAFERNGPYVER